MLFRSPAVVLNGQLRRYDAIALCVDDVEGVKTSDAVASDGVAAWAGVGGARGWSVSANGVTSHRIYSRSDEKLKLEVVIDAVLGAHLARVDGSSLVGHERGRCLVGRL